MRTYGSNITLQDGLTEDRVLSRVQGFFNTLADEDFAPEVDTSLLRSATNLDQLFAAFGLVLRRSGDETIIGASSAGQEWVHAGRLFEALVTSLETGSWFAFDTGMFDMLLLVDQTGVQEHIYQSGTLDPEEGPYFQYPHGTPAPEPGNGDRLDQQTRMVQHWHHHVTLLPCQATSLTEHEATSFLADARR